MEDTRKLNHDLGTIGRSAFLIEKVHRCADCPIRQLAIKRPQSIFTRLHNWHRTWWPGWQAHQARSCAYAAKTGTQA
jgi:hypothetical protein